MIKRVSMILFAAILVVGCGNKQAELERQRKEAELAAQREAEAKATADRIAAEKAAAEAEAKAAAERAEAETKALAAKGKRRVQAAKAAAEKKGRGVKEVVVDSAKATGGAVETGAKKTKDGATWLGRKVAAGASGAVDAMKKDDKPANTLKK